MYIPQIYNFFEFNEDDIKYFEKLIRFLEQLHCSELAKSYIRENGFYVDTEGNPEKFSDYFIYQLEESIVVSLIDNLDIQAYEKEFLLESWHDITGYRRSNYFKDCDILDEVLFKLIEIGLL